jgi:hypothetical protein
MMLRGAPPTSRAADNPLVSGQPLETSEKASLGILGEQDCNVWPFDDTLAVNVTEAEICIAIKKHVEQPPGWRGEPTANRTEGFQVANDASEGGYISTEKRRAAKVGSCFDKGYNQQVSIWAFEYQGCAPNNSTVTAATRSLRVGDEEWTFAAAAPPPVEATEPQAATTPATAPAE